jgi:hypothetical protein
MTMGLGILALLIAWLNTHIFIKRYSKQSKEFGTISPFFIRSGEKRHNNPLARRPY